MTTCTANLIYYCNFWIWTILSDTYMREFQLLTIVFLPLLSLSLVNSLSLSLSLLLSLSVTYLSRELIMYAEWSLMFSLSLFLSLLSRECRCCLMCDHFCLVICKTHWLARETSVCLYYQLSLSTVEYRFRCMFQHARLGVAQNSVIQDVLHATRMDAQAAEMAST